MKRHVLNLGDVDYLEYGGWLVYDHPPDAVFAEVIEPPCDDGPEEWTVYRFDLDQCTHVNGVLSDNPYHPEAAAWFGSPDDLASIAKTMDYPDGAERLIHDLCSGTTGRLADAYHAIVGYFGAYEFDQYPETFNRCQIEAAYPEG